MEAAKVDKIEGTFETSKKMMGRLFLSLSLSLYLQLLVDRINSREPVGSKTIRVLGSAGQGHQFINRHRISIPSRKKRGRYRPLPIPGVRDARS